MKAVLAAIATLTGLAAAYTVVHTLAGQDTSVLWAGSRSLVSVAVVGTGILTWVYWRQSTARIQDLLFLGGILLIAVGSFGAAWNIHLGLVTGDFDAPVYLLTVAVAATGMLTVFMLWRDARQISQAQPSPQ